MDLSVLLSLIEQPPGYRQLKGELTKSQKKGIKLVVTDAVKPFVIASLHQGLNVPVLAVVAQPESAKSLYDELQAWGPSSTLPPFFPDIDFLAGEYSAS